MKRLLALNFFLLCSVAWANRLTDIKTVFIILLENHNWAEFKGSTNAPYLNQTLLPRASYCERYFNPPGLHPSLPNYLWLEAGTNFGILDNKDPSAYHQSTTNHLVVLLERAGISWRTYQEDIDGITIPLSDTNHYAVRHNPFVYFDDVTGTNNPNYAYGINHIRPLDELAGHLTGNTVARYNFITPNLCNAGHDSCPPFSNQVFQADTWLANVMPAILSSAAYSNSGAVFITWDEGNDVASDGPIGMVVLSPLARGDGYSNAISYTHSSTIRALQEIFKVGPLLGDAQNAIGLDDLFAEFGISHWARLTNGNFQLTLSGLIPDKTNLVQSSDDLISWSSINTNVSASGDAVVIDSRPASAIERFYRLVQVP